MTARTVLDVSKHPRDRVKAAWEAKHDSSLVDRLVSELSGDFETLCLALLKVVSVRVRGWGRVRGRARRRCASQC